MSGSDEARIRLGVDGADEATAKVNAYRKAWADLGERLANPPQPKGWDAVADRIGGRVKELTGSVARLGLGVRSLDFGAAVQRADDYDRAVTKVAVATGRNIDDLKAKYRQLGKENLMSGGQAEALVKTFSRATYDIRGAEKALSGLHKEAVATGRTDEEMAPLYEVLHNVLNVSGRTESALGKVRAQAEMIGQGGAEGVQKYQDLLVSLSGTLQTVSSDTKGAREESIAFAAAATRGMSAEKQQRVGGRLANPLAGRAIELERTLGYNPLDDKGEWKAPVKDLRKVFDYNRKTRGMGEKQQRWALMNLLGEEAGTIAYTALKRGDDKSLEGLVNAKPSQEAEKAAQRYNATPAAERTKAQLAQQAALDKVADKTALPLQSAVANTIADHPYAALAAGALAPSLAGAGVKAVGGRLLAGAGARLAPVATNGLVRGMAGVLGGAAAVAGAGYAGYQAGSYADEKLGLSDKLSKGIFEWLHPEADKATPMTPDMLPAQQPPPEPEPEPVIDRKGAQLIADAINDALRRSPLAVAAVPGPGTPPAPTPPTVRQ